jgi:hypothetical protein
MTRAFRGSPLNARKACRFRGPRESCGLMAGVGSIHLLGMPAGVALDWSADLQVVLAATHP